MTSSCMDISFCFSIIIRDSIQKVDFVFCRILFLLLAFKLYFISKCISFKFFSFFREQKFTFSKTVSPVICTTVCSVGTSASSIKNAFVYYFRRNGYFCHHFYFLVQRRRRRKLMKKYRQKHTHTHRSNSKICIRKLKFSMIIMELSFCFPFFFGPKRY